VAKPERNLADIPRRLKHVHCAAMSKDVWRYCLGRN
jgi:hypothetical protein